MNIYDYAMQIELEGEKYYRELAEKTNNEGLKNILIMLADEEVKHYKVLKKMKDTDPNAELAVTDVLKEAKNVFIEMKSKAPEFKLNEEQVDFYKKAFQIEDENANFYLDKIDECESEHHKDIFRKLADEEKRHAFLLDNLVDFISQPNMWLENAEFTHLDDY